MLARSVAGVDDRDRRDSGGAPGRSLLVVAQDDDIGVAADDLDRVFEGLALCGGREFPSVVGTHRLATESQHGGLEGQTGSGRRFVKQCRHHLSGQAPDEVVGFALDLFGAREQVFEDGSRELLTLDYVPQPGRDGHKKISFPGSLSRT